uniref:Uncharacterized protein n=1 Tax=Anguilla anguilla TaxID=7936 RepID=A0A0E9XU39_ANGAN
MECGRALHYPENTSGESEHSSTVFFFSFLSFSPIASAAGRQGAGGKNSYL